MIYPGTCNVNVSLAQWLSRPRAPGIFKNLSKLEYNSRHTLANITLFTAPHNFNHYPPTLINFALKTLTWYYKLMTSHITSMSCWQNFKYQERRSRLKKNFLFKWIQQSFLFNHCADSSTFLRLILKKLDRNHHQCGYSPMLDQAKASFQKQTLQV